MTHSQVLVKAEIFPFFHLWEKVEHGLQPAQQNSPDSFDSFSDYTEGIFGLNLNLTRSQCGVETAYKKASLMIKPGLEPGSSLEMKYTLPQNTITHPMQLEVETF